MWNRLLQLPAFLISQPQRAPRAKIRRIHLVDCFPFFDRLRLSPAIVEQAPEIESRLRILRIFFHRIRQRRLALRSISKPLHRPSRRPRLFAILRCRLRISSLLHGVGQRVEVEWRRAPRVFVARRFHHLQHRRSFLPPAQRTIENRNLHRALGPLSHQFDQLVPDRLVSDQKIFLRLGNAVRRINLFHLRQLLERRIFVSLIPLRQRQQQMRTEILRVRFDRASQMLSRCREVMMFKIQQSKLVLARAIVSTARPDKIKIIFRQLLFAQLHLTRSQVIPTRVRIGVAVHSQLKLRRRRLKVFLVELQYSQQLVSSGVSRILL